MTKKIFLTSAVIMCMACPAIAENFPQDGNMLENKTYDNAATYANTGIYEGDVTADAEYSLNPYSVAAGSYFTGIDNSTNQATTAQCTSGNFCPGVQSTTFDNNAFGDTGLQTCPSGYASSDLGASANTQCYRTCDIANMGENGTIAAIAHAASLTGHDYYGNGTDTCEPATCVSGWHKERASLADTIGTGTGENSAYTNGNAQESWLGGGYYFSEINYDGKGSKGAEYYGINTSNPNTWAVDYGGTHGILQGKARCSSVWGNAASYASSVNDITIHTQDELGAEGGYQCYCKAMRYITNAGAYNIYKVPTYPSWVYLKSEGNESDCRSGCSAHCAEYARGASSSNLFFRAALLTYTEFNAGRALCAANTINITWNDASAEDIAATGAATTVYEGDIKTPLKAITKPGKTFVGWKFIKPAATPVEP